MSTPVYLYDLSAQPWPRIGLVCVRCAGQVVRTHRDADAACLWCGWVPLERPDTLALLDPAPERKSRTSPRMPGNHTRVAIRLGVA